MSDINKKLEEIECRVASILSENEETLKGIEKQLSLEREKYEKLQLKLKENAFSGNNAEYSKIKKRMDDISVTIKMLEQRFKLRTEGPLIVEAEYIKLVNEIQAGLEELTLQNKEEVVELVGRLQEIAQEHNALCDRGNNLLNKLQKDVYRYADAKKDPSGKPLEVEIKQHNDYSLQYYVERITDNVVYESIVESVNQHRE